MNLEKQMIEYLKDVATTLDIKIDQAEKRNSLKLYNSLVFLLNVIKNEISALEEAEDLKEESHE